MGILQAIIAIAQLVMPVASLMLNAEQALGAGKGAQKKSMVLDTITEGATAAGTAASEVKAVVPVVSSLIEVLHSIFQKHGWDKAAETMPQIQATLGQVSAVAGTVESVAGQVSNTFPSSADSTGG